MQRLTFTCAPGRAVIYLLVLTLLGLSMGVVVGKAAAATPQPPERQVQQQVQCATQDAGACNTPTKKAKRLNRKFHRGDLGTANGFSPRQVFKHPRKARKIVVGKITRMLRAYRAAGGEGAARMVGTRARAAGIYTAMVNDSDCVQGSLARDWSATANFMPCDWAADSDLIGNIVVNALAVTACAGGVAVTLFTPVGRAAGKALKFWGTTFQMTSCTAMALQMGRG